MSSATLLQHLELVGCPQLNKDAVQHLCQGGLPSLLSLTLTHVQISPQAVLLLTGASVIPPPPSLTHSLTLTSTENCPSLQHLQLTISFTDYYPDPDSLTNDQHIRKYQRIITNLTVSGHPVCEGVWLTL